MARFGQLLKKGEKEEEEQRKEREKRRERETPPLLGIKLPWYHCCKHNV